MKYILRIVIIAFFGLHALTAIGQDTAQIDVRPQEKAEGITILFPSAVTTIQKDYLSNPQSLSDINRLLSAPDILDRVQYIVISGAASPEGILQQNQSLAVDRALVVKSYILSEFPWFPTDRILTNSVGEDWDGLCKMIEKDPGVPAKERVLDLLRSDANSYAKKVRLKQIDGGAAYSYIYKNILPYLRTGSTLVLQYFKGKEPEIPPPVTLVRVDTVYIPTHSSDTVYVETHDTLVEQYPFYPIGEYPDTTALRHRRPYYMSVKNNLLYDCILLPNLALEFSLPRRWSVEVEGAWSWWDTKHEATRRFWRIQAAGFEVRKWLGRADRTPLTGHRLGVYAMGGTYDVKINFTGHLSDWSYSAGISYGYATPIGRRLNLEFSLAVGYLGGEYKNYFYDYFIIDPYYDHDVWIETLQRNYFGPTKASVSLVWLIGSGVNPGKGDAR